MKALVLIDLQEGFRDPRWGRRNNPLLEEKVEDLVKFFRDKGLPILHVRHASTESGSSLRRELPGFAFFPCATPNGSEAVFTKSAHGAFIGTGFEEHLRRHGITEPCFAGLTADHCVSTSVRMAHDLGFVPIVVTDAVATFPRESAPGRWLGADAVQECALASLRGEFARTMSTEELRRSL